MEKVGCVLLLAVTAACSDGSGLSGSGGNAAGGAGSASARAGSGGNAAGGTANADAPPACVADGVVVAPESPVSGSVLGARLRAALCSGGEMAHVEVTPSSLAFASQTLFVLHIATSGDQQTHFNIQLPEEALTGSLTGFVGMPGPAPGTYASESGCGSLALCVTLPIPADLDCSDPACPPGCALQGPVSDPACAPITPELCYDAEAASDCVGDTVAPRGSWSLTLASVDSYAPDMNAQLVRFVAHGTLNAELLNPDDSTDSVQLSIAF